MKKEVKVRRFKDFEVYLLWGEVHVHYCNMGDKECVYSVGVELLKKRIMHNRNLTLNQIFNYAAARGLPYYTITGKRDYSEYKIIELPEDGMEKKWSTIIYTDRCLCKIEDISRLRQLQVGTRKIRVREIFLDRSWQKEAKEFNKPMPFYVIDGKTYDFYTGDEI